MMAEARSEAAAFAERLAETVGAQLRSVVLHGSVARGEAVAGVSDVNLLVLVDAVDADLLRRLAPEARRWLERERSLPLVLTWDEWAAATDVFAIETADMLDAREVLRGDDPLAGVSVRPEELRLQAERELRAKLIHLREGTLATADRPAELGRLLLRAMPAVAAYLRAALRLAGRPVPGTTPQVLDAGCALVGAEAAPLRRLWDQRGSKKGPTPDVGDPAVAAVHGVLERTVEYVDQLAGGDEA